MSGPDLESVRQYVENVRRTAFNRWPQTLAALGVGAEYLTNRHGPCPGCGGRDRFRFDDRDGRGTFICGGGGGDPIAGDGFALIEHIEGRDFMSAVDLVASVYGIERGNGLRSEQRIISVKAPARTPEPLRRDTLSDAGRDLWNECVPLRGDGLAYLQARQCVIPPADGDLRCHPELRHPSGYTGPALVGLVTHAELAHAMSLHFTWVRADGRKADIDRPRLYLAGHQKAGGVIRLWPDEAVTHGLGIGEGIESTLSLAHGFKPVWACLDAGNLSQFPPLPGVESLLIAADHDDAGLKAAEACGRAWLHAGREVRVIVPPARGADVNDIVRRAA